MSPKKRILVVDDDEAILSTIEHTLLAEGYEVDTASNGQQALQKLKAGQLPSAILSDLAMHPVDGRAFIGHLKQDPTTQNIPVVVVSAEKDLRSVAGAVAVVEKPFIIDELLGVLHAVIGH